MYSCISLVYGLQWYTLAIFIVYIFYPLFNGLFIVCFVFFKGRRSVCVSCAIPFVGRLLDVIYVIILCRDAAGRLTWHLFSCFNRTGEANSSERGIRHPSTIAFKWLLMNQWYECIQICSNWVTGVNTTRSLGQLTLSTFFSWRNSRNVTNCS